MWFPKTRDELWEAAKDFVRSMPDYREADLIFFVPREMEYAIRRWSVDEIGCNHRELFEEPCMTFMGMHMARWAPRFLLVSLPMRERGGTIEERVVWAIHAYTLKTYYGVEDPEFRFWPE